MNNTQRISQIISTHIFIFATSLAMLVHSTWTFGTLFSGKQPTIDGSPDQWIKYFLWVTPALLVALAIDIGQIQTSVKLSQAYTPRETITLGITFVTLALAGYYLQWFHLAHHIPALEFGSGLAPDMRNNLEGLKSMAIFIVPALLPLSTILYTLSSSKHHTPAATVATDLQLPNVEINYPMLEESDTEPIEALQIMNSNIHTPKSVTRTVVAGDTDKTCEHCEKQIPHARPNQKYCNVVCRNNAYKARLKVH